MLTPFQRTFARRATFAVAVAVAPACDLQATLVPPIRPVVIVSAPPPPQGEVVVAAPAPPPPPAPPQPAVVVVGAPPPVMAVQVSGPVVTISPGIAIVTHLPIGFDMVGAGDSAVHPDGQPEGTFAASLEGPIDGLILVTTDASGAPCCGQQWDTLVGQDPLPHIGSAFNGVGESTWVLGVMEKKSLVNDANGRVFLGPGKHAVLIGGSPSGYFKPGQYFRLLVHHPGAGEWNGGPVFVW